MPVTQELYLALLALDSYNQGAEPGLDGVGDSIGAAQKVITFDRLGAGFSATRYTLNGKTVISYRGTDDPTGVFSGNDILNGWSLALGYSGASQAGLAMQFYKDVTGRNVFDGRVSNVILTGHSLRKKWGQFEFRRTGDMLEPVIGRP